MGAMSATRRWSRRKALSLVLVGLLVLSSSCALVARAEDEDYEEGGSGDGYVSPQKDSGDFAGDLADAIEQQEFREEADKEVVSHIVDVAPEADLANGDGDVSTTQNCTVDIDVFCSDVTPGKGRLAKCLQEQVNEEKVGNSEGRSVSESCKYELKSFQYDRATNINVSIPYCPGLQGEHRGALRRHHRGRWRGRHHPDPELPEEEEVPDLPDVPQGAHGGPAGAGQGLQDELGALLLVQ